MSDSPLKTKASPLQLRDELEAMAVGDLFGPAGVPEEQRTERNARDRDPMGLLTRLLKPNHERHAEEVRQGLHEKKRAASNKRATGKTTIEEANLFGSSA
jgi:hypothetical protein